MHDRNHSTENLIRCYGRVTVIRRAPQDTREALLQRYAASGVSFPTSSFLRPVEERTESRGGRAGTHHIVVRFSRRNHKTILNPEIEAPMLWKLVKQEFPNSFQTAKISSFKTTTGLSLNGYVIKRVSVCAPSPKLPAGGQCASDSGTDMK